jgi:glycine dehydrogenase subunit 1
MDFIPHDEDTIAKMLKDLGINEIADLFKDIPKELLHFDLNLPEAMSEPNLLKKISDISKKNKLYCSSFLGAGIYYHYIPSLVDFVINRSEFYTSYTPYQAEASQGYLQAIYEYQTIISRLTQMDIANASMYDGSTALAEAAIMATIITGKNLVLIIEGIHPEYIQVVKTYCWGQGITVKVIKEDDLEKEINEGVSSVLIQSPNFFGDILDLTLISTKIRNLNSKCLIIQVMTDPTCLGILNPPGVTGVDIFVAEGQSFGIAPSFGGPGLGIFTAKERFLRKMPGRLVGKTRELFGEKEGFLLTLQAREQHIRREKASSNICTNQALCALSALVYLLSVGKTGLKEIATQNVQKSNYLKTEIAKIKGFKILNQRPTYNEFMVRVPNLKSLINECKNEDLLPPLELTKYFPDMANIALVCVTESNTRESIEEFLNIAKKISEVARN